MELQAEDMGIFFVFDGLDHLPVNRGGGDLEPLADPPGGLVMGAHDIRMVGRLEPERGREFVRLRELDRMEHVGQEGLV